jgi:hypothetical protein
MPERGERGSQVVLEQQCSASFWKRHYARLGRGRELWNGPTRPAPSSSAINFELSHLQTPNNHFALQIRTLRVAPVVRLSVVERIVGVMKLWEERQAITTLPR